MATKTFNKMSRRVLAPFPPSLRHYKGALKTQTMRLRQNRQNRLRGRLGNVLFDNTGGEDPGKAADLDSGQLVFARPGASRQSQPSVWL